MLAELMPNAELMMLASEDELMASIPMLVSRCSAFLADGTERVSGLDARSRSSTVAPPIARGELIGAGLVRR